MSVQTEDRYPIESGRKGGNFKKQLCNCGLLCETDTKIKSQKLSKLDTIYGKGGRSKQVGEDYVIEVGVIFNETEINQKGLT